jgi:ubiquinol-cytochrome c reductase cytochrome b subunit
VIARAVRFLDERTGSVPGLRKALRYVFPDHWTFLLGEIALYSFMVLIGTGVFLTLFFEPSSATTTYTGSYAPLQGLTITEAYNSALALSFDVDGGLLFRQTHHWAALTFVVAIVLHLMRIFFTGAFRRPRDINYYVGLTMLTLAIIEGYAGYSLLGDLLSGMGMVIGYGVALSIPVIGSDVGTLIWNGPFPGAPDFISRLYLAHVLLLPVAIGVLLTVHLTLVALPHHSQFPGRGRTERNVVGTPTWPAYAVRSVGLLFAVAAVLFALGGLIQINPVWQWGPYEPFQGTNGAQPDWYMGWLIGALRLMPSFDLVIGDYTLIPNPFFGGILLPTLLFAFLYGWPAIERRVTGDTRPHNLLDRPRDNPWRSGIGAAVFVFVALMFFAGAADRLFVQFAIPYEGQIWFFRAAIVILPLLTYWLVKRVCEELRDRERHPMRGFPGQEVRRTAEGGFESVGPNGGGRRRSAVTPRRG